MPEEHMYMSLWQKVTLFRHVRLWRNNVYSAHVFLFLCVLSFEAYFREINKLNLVWLW